jgi:hypothetical protein
MGRLDEAKATIERALPASRECGDATSVASNLDTQATIEWISGDVHAARELFAQALAAYKTLGNEFGTAVVLSNLAELEFADAHPEQALCAANEALEISLRGKNATFIASCYTNGAAYRVALGELAGARESARNGLRVACQGRGELLIAAALQHLALLAAIGGDVRCGAPLLGYVDAQYTALGQQREPTEQWGYDKLMSALRETLSEDEIATLGAEGASWSEDQAVEEALKV